MHSMVHQSAGDWRPAIGMPRRSLLKGIVDKIDELAFLLTGHRKFYHLKPHST